MQAALKTLHSPDVANLEVYEPEESSCFGFLLQMMIGPAGMDGSESFDLVVCTPEWLLRRNGIDSLVPGRYMLIVFRYDYPRLVDYLTRTVASFEGSSWKDIAWRLSRFARWEFEDYRSMPSA